MPGAVRRAGLLPPHHLVPEIPGTLLVLSLIDWLRVAQHQQLMIRNALMIARVMMRPGISMEPHRLIKAQPFMGDLAGERIDFQNSQRGARQDLRQQLFTIAAGAQRVVSSIARCSI